MRQATAWNVLALEAALLLANSGLAQAERFLAAAAETRPDERITPEWRQMRETATVLARAVARRETPSESTRAAAARAFDAAMAVPCQTPAWQQRADVMG